LTKLKYLLVLFCFILNPTPIFSQSQTIAERIAFAAFRHGQWDLYSITPDGSDPR